MLIATPGEIVSKKLGDQTPGTVMNVASIIFINQTLTKSQKRKLLHIKEIKQLKNLFIYLGKWK